MVQEYTIEFNDKARFAKHLVHTKERNIDKVGLRTLIHEFIWDSKYTTFRHVVDAARDSEIELRHQKQEKERVGNRETIG